jgi:hypothetical protein
MQLVNITVGGNRIGVNIDQIVTITWTTPDYYLDGGTAKMIDGSTIALDTKAMLKLQSMIKIVDTDWDNQYER